MKKKIVKTDIFFYAAFLIVCIFVLLSSALAPFAKSSNGVDSSVFIYSARQILHGQIIYKDIIDHKGPFLYLIDEAALFFLNGKFIGIWILEIISLFVASIMMYKTARFFSSRISSFFAVVTTILFLVRLLNGGNLSEEWVLPFISIALYIFVAYLKDNKPLTIFRLFILALTFVLTFMIRANLAAIWVSFGIILLTKWIVEKKHKELIRSVLFISLFVLLFLLPFFLYFYFKGALSDAVYLVFKYNMFEYEPIPFSLILKRGVKILAGLYFMSVIPFTIVTYMFLRNRTIVNGSVLAAFILTALTCSLGRLYDHYFMIFAPLLVIPYAYVFEVIKDSFPKAKYALLLILFIIYNYIPSIVQAQYVAENYSEEGYGPFVVPPPTMRLLKKVIIQNTKPTDKILVRGNQASLYLYSDRACATRFPFFIEKTPLTTKYYVKEAEEALPKLIIQGKLINDESSLSLNLDTLLNEKYRLMPTNIEGVEIWKLNEQSSQPNN